MIKEFKRRGGSRALELALPSPEGELNLKSRWVRCVRLLNGYDHETTIDMHYDDGSRKHFTIGARRIIFFGTAELGIFERVLPSFWDRLRLQLRYHNTLFERMVVRDGSHVLHDIDRRTIKRDFLRFYAHPSDFRGTCMRLDSDGFSFVDSCARLSEFCDEDGCRFESRPRNCCAPRESGWRGKRFRNDDRQSATCSRRKPSGTLVTLATVLCADPRLVQSDSSRYWGT